MIVIPEDSGVTGAETLFAAPSAKGVAAFIRYVRTRVQNGNLEPAAELCFCRLLRALPDYQNLLHDVPPEGLTLRVASPARGTETVLKAHDRNDMSRYIEISAKFGPDNPLAKALKSVSRERQKIQTAIREASEPHKNLTKACLLYTSPSPRD